MADLETQILFITNLPKDIKTDSLLKMFKKFGNLIQIRIGNSPKTEGSAFVIFDNIETAVKAKKRMNGYVMENKFINIVFWQPTFSLADKT
jgi:pre-mRNA branch site protein p14